jgi:hypothetical protein
VSIRQSSEGSHVTLASITAPRSSGYFSKSPWKTKLITCDIAHWVRSTCHSAVVARVAGHGRRRVDTYALAPDVHGHRQQPPRSISSFTTTILGQAIRDRYERRYGETSFRKISFALQPVPSRRELRGESILEETTSLCMHRTVCTGHRSRFRTSVKEAPALARNQEITSRKRPLRASGASWSWGRIRNVF